jgi:hypothetical protein
MQSVEENKILPQHLSWRCLDNFDKISDDKIFHVGKINLSHIKRANLQIIFANLRNKWKQKLDELVQSWHEERRTHFEISGGNYTFFFILPEILTHIRQRFPHLRVKLSLYEGETHLLERNSDIFLTSFSFTGIKSIKSALMAGYKIFRKSYQDSMFFAASKEAVQKFGGIANTLAKHDFLFNRYYSRSARDIQIWPGYSFIPEGREQDMPRVSVDQYFLKYVLMCNSIGIGHVHKKTMHNQQIVMLREIDLPYTRFCIVKDYLNSKYNSIARDLMKVLEKEI